MNDFVNKIKGENMRHKRGFTLIELVVVIAILGILAGIAIPRFLQAQAAARGAKVLSDLRILDSAISQYAAYNGTDPTTIAELVPHYVSQEPAPPSETFRIKQNNGTEKDFTPASTTTSYLIVAQRATLDGAEKTVEWYLNGSGSTQPGGGSESGGGNNLQINGTTNWSDISKNSQYQYGYQTTTGQIFSDGSGYYIAINAPYLSSSDVQKDTLAEVAASNASIVKIDTNNIQTIAANTETLNNQIVWKADALPKTGDVYQVGSDYYVCLRGAGSVYDVTRDPASNPQEWKKL